MYSGPSCLSSRLCSVAISWAVYSDMRCFGSSKGLAMLACCCPGLAEEKLACRQDGVATTRFVDVGRTYAGMLTEVRLSLSWDADEEANPGSDR
jgi:hypothetical protein